MLNPETHSFIPSNQDFPPLVVKKQGEVIYSEMEKPLTVEDEPVKFAINRNLVVSVKRIIREYSAEDGRFILHIQLLTDSYLRSGLLRQPRRLVSDD